VLEFGGDNVRGMLGNHGQELGVGLVGKRIAAGFDDDPGVEITIGDVMIDAIEVGQDEAQRFDGAIEALDVKDFGLLIGAFDGE
jgi:hypothetical protein